MLIATAVLVAQTLTPIQEDHSIRLTGKLNTVLTEGDAWIAHVDTRGSSGILSRPVHLEVDDSGVFVASMRSPVLFEEEHDYTLTIRERDSGRAGRVTWTMIPRPGEREVGALALGVAPVLVSGHLYDAAGDVVVDAGIEVQVLTTGPDGSDDSSYLPYLNSSTDEEGWFVVRGFLDEDIGRLRLRAHGSGIPLDSSFLVELGARQLELGCEARAELRGRVLLRDDVPVQDLAVCISPEGTQSTTRRPVHPDGTFAYDDLRQGRHSVSLRLTSPPMTLFSQEVELLAGRPVELPEIDLRNRLMTTTLRIVSPDGALVQNARGYVRHRGEEELRSFHPISRNGTIQIVRTAPLEELIVDVSGYRRHVARQVGDFHEVRLEPMYEVFVQLVGRELLPKANSVRIGFATGKSSPQPRAEVRAGELGLDDQARVLLAQAGAYSPTVTLTDAQGRVAWSGRVTDEWHVLDFDGPQSFSLVLTPEAITKIEQRWAERLERQGD